MKRLDVKLFRELFAMDWYHQSNIELVCLGLKIMSIQLCTYDPLQYPSNHSPQN